MMNPWKLPLFSSVLFSLIILFTHNAYGAFVGDTFPTGDDPFDLAVNPSTNKVYLANGGDLMVKVYDGYNGKFIANFSLAFPAVDIAANPKTDQIYVSNGIVNYEYVPNTSTSQISVVDGRTDKVVANISTGVVPALLAINPNTNMIYAAYANDPVQRIRYGSGGEYGPDTPLNMVSVIDGSTNTPVASITVPSTTLGLTVDSKLNNVYVLQQLSSELSISVIDGFTNKIKDDIRVHTGVSFVPDVIAFNPNTDTIYVANLQLASLAGNGIVYAIDANTHKLLANLTVGSKPVAMSVNQDTNTIFVANQDSGSISVINGLTNKLVGAIPLSKPAQAIALNPTTKRLYVTNGPSTTTSYTSSISVVYDPDTTFETASKPFTFSTKIGQNDYLISGKSENVGVLSFNPHPSLQAVGITLDAKNGGGEIELTLPKRVLTPIFGVGVAGQDVPFQTISENAISETVRFTVEYDKFRDEINATNGKIEILIMSWPFATSSSIFISDPNGPYDKEDALGLFQGVFGFTRVPDLHPITLYQIIDDRGAIDQIIVRNDTAYDGTTCAASGCYELLSPRTSAMIDHVGNYTLEAYLWSDLTHPIPLANVAKWNFILLERTSEVSKGDLQLHLGTPQKGYGAYCGFMASNLTSTQISLCHELRFDVVLNVTNKGSDDLTLYDSRHLPLNITLYAKKNGNYQKYNPTNSSCGLHVADNNKNGKSIQNNTSTVVIGAGSSIIMDCTYKIEYSSSNYVYDMEAVGSLTGSLSPWDENKYGQKPKTEDTLLSTNPIHFNIAFAFPPRVGY